MKENLGVLSNTYTKAESEAAGVFPLADSDVLLAEVLEYSKYTVPTRLAAEILPLDTPLNDLTKSCDLVGNIFNVSSAGMEMATSFDTCQTDLQVLKDRLDECANLKVPTVVVFSAFSGFTEACNSTLNTMKTQVATAWEQVNAAKRRVEAAENAVEAAQRALDSAGQDEDTTGLQEALASARAELEAAQRELEETVSRNRTELVSQESAVEGQKREYIAALTKLRDKVTEAKEATVKAQESVNDTVSKGTDFVGTMAETVYESREKSREKNKETLEAMKKLQRTTGIVRLSGIWRDRYPPTKRPK